MKRSRSNAPDYAFGQVILSVRSALGLTQAGLAAQLGVSRNAISTWEAGISYPKLAHLIALTVLALQHQVWPPGGEVEAIRALWRAARQKVLLDEAWLAALLRDPSLARAGCTLGRRRGPTELSPVPGARGLHCGQAPRRTVVQHSMMGGLTAR